MTLAASKRIEHAQTLLDAIELSEKNNSCLTIENMSDAQISADLIRLKIRHEQRDVVYFTGLNDEWQLKILKKPSAPIPHKIIDASITPYMWGFFTGAFVVMIFDIAQVIINGKVF